MGRSGNSGGGGDPLAGEILCMSLPVRADFTLWREVLPACDLWPTGVVRKKRGRGGLLDVVRGRCWRTEGEARKAAAQQRCLLGEIVMSRYTTSGPWCDRMLLVSRRVKLGVILSYPLTR